ncbi:hypothetical protein HPP92_022830 [Vanilla planifolia]|uniref:Uncharacterized protein n=1 Tax=Vanilla planifolia TaxID=51239 RepID=A0A835Q1C9_VANPL|nr:hypothetical protein HPP92_022830 [Vanilla planifolia]
MIKRRFYKVEHGDNSCSSDSSSSDDSGSDFDPEVDAEKEEEEKEDEDQKGRGDGSGYESEDSLNNDDYNDASVDSGEQDVNYNSNSVGHVADDFVKPSEMTKITVGPNDPIHEDISNFIIKFKSVFKCRLCPRILCLNETSVTTHLTSKRHARSRKLFSEGRLKLMLNSDGELEEEQETHAERHARILALSQKLEASKKKDNGRQRGRTAERKRCRGCAVTQIRVN